MFAAGTVGHFVFHWEDMTWLKMWQFYVMLAFVLGIFTTVWFLIAGFRDIGRLFKSLASNERNLADNGQVIDGQNADEVVVKHTAESEK